MIIRLADHTDLPFLAEKGLLPSNNRTILVAGQDGNLRGAIAFAPSLFESDLLERAAAKIELLEIWQVQDQRQIISALLDKAIKTLLGTGHNFVSARIDEGANTATAAIDILQSRGFRMIECLLTLQHPLGSDAVISDPTIEVASTDDADECADLASQIFVSDRFHADPEISKAAADRVKAEWIRNSCHGRADRVFIARLDGKIVGFNACNLSAEQAVIELIGTAREVRGQGFGKRLVNAALNHYCRHAKTMRVGTQSSNQASLSLYQDTGFYIVSSALTLHLTIKDQP